MSCRVLLPLAILLNLSVVFLGLPQAGRASDPTIDLAGQWSFRLDEQDQGIGEKWFETALPEKIMLPGSTDEAGFGTKTTDRKEYWLNRVFEYVGPAWYQREVEIPEGWQGKRISLHLERCHWETQLWVDGQPAGMQDSLCTGHRYDLTSLLTPGKHRLSIRVDNRIKINVGPDAHSTSDHTQTNWNGIIGRIALRATDSIWIDDIQVYPDLQAKRATVRLIVGNTTGKPGQGNLALSAKLVDGAGSPVTANRKGPITDQEETHVKIELPMGDDVKFWDEFSPNLYELTVSLSADAEGTALADTRQVRFGMREFRTRGTQFTINDRLTFLRGTLECCIFPLTGYPPMEPDGWRRIIRIAKAHGLNHFRFHSWCPPESAFVAADEEGFYFHVETPVWTILGHDPVIDGFIYAEGDRILRDYGNHPSFCMLAVGNEPSGQNQRDFLGKIVTYWKEKDSRHVYTSTSGWPSIPENEFHSRPDPRGHGWGAGLSSRFNSRRLSTDVDYSGNVAKYDIPLVSHEIGQWCVYPNFKEIEKYTGVTRARNFEIFRDSLKNNHMLDQAEAFLMASGKWQALLYKEEIEAALRTPGFGGFQLLDLHDFPGQGTALIGVLDAFWDSKGYLTAEQHHRYCAEVVPLLRMKKCVWTTDELFSAEANVANYGQGPIADAVPQWTVRYADGRQIASGQLPKQTIGLGGGIPLGHVDLPLADVEVPAKLIVELSIKGLPYANHWDVWVYPAKVDTLAPEGVMIAGRLDNNVWGNLRGGGKVLLTVPAERIRSNVPSGFTNIFWNTQWTKGQPPHTLGLLCDPNHPALAKFPTDFHSNWQWWDLVAHGRAMILDDLPPEFRPVVQVVDDWNTNRRLGLVIEAKVDNGQLLMSSIDLSGDLSERPVARQMLASLLAYMDSDAFAPRETLAPDQIRALLREPPLSTYAKIVMFSSQATDHEAPNVIDGDPSTSWHSAWEDDEAEHPHELQIELQKETEIKGFLYTPRQDMTNGRVADFEIYLSDNGQDWGQPAAKGTLANTKEEQKIELQSSRTARFIRFVALSEVEGNPWASVAELDLIK